MADSPQTVTLMGIPVANFKVMEARRNGICDLTRQKFPAGTTILYKSGASLTRDEIGVFKRLGSGDVERYGVTVIWDEALAADAQDEDLDCSPEQLTPFGRKMQEERETKTPAPHRQGKREFKPSEYQQKIKDVLFTTATNILISALAGCGKTSTLVWLIKELVAKGFLQGRKVYFLAFNANIRDEVTPDLQGTGVPALTTHQFCLRNVLEYKIDKKEKNKGERNRRVFLKVVMDLAEAQDEWAAKKSAYWAYRKQVLKLVSLTKNWAVLPEFDGKGWVFDDSRRKQILNIIDLYKIDPQDELDPDVMVHLTCAVISYSLPAPGVCPAEYDFDDMLYHPLVLNLPIPKVDLVFVDEVQDLNAAQIRILSRMEQNGTRIVAVGDKNQAIYMFRGADARAWDRLIGMLQQSRRTLEICELPINYRSLPCILDYARMLVPGLIGFREGQGVMSFDTPFETMMEMFREESEKAAKARSKMAVICRNRAPLVQAGYAAIGAGQVVCFLGKGDITKPLIDMIDMVAGYKNKDTNRISDLRDDRDGSIRQKGFWTLLGEHVRSVKAQYEGQEEMADFLEELADTAECLRVIAGAVRDDRVDSIRREIDTRFVEKPIPGSITFTTVHGAKGLQWTKVFGIRKDLMPSPRVQQFNPDGTITDEYQQELNLDYIWRTRGEDECHVISTWPFGKGMGEILDEHSNYDQGESDAFWGMQGSDKPAYDDRLFDVPSVVDHPTAAPPSGWGVRSSEPLYSPVTVESRPVAPVRREKIRFVDDGKPF